MKQIITLKVILLCSLLAWEIPAQKVDTIFVNATSTVYIILPNSVDLVDVGSKKYGHQIQETANNIVFLKSVPVLGKEIPPPTSIFIKYGNEYYSGTIVYKEKIQKNMYDFRLTTTANSSKDISKTTSEKPVSGNSTSNSVGSTTHTSSSSPEQSTNDSNISKNLLILKDKKPQFKSLGEISNSLSIFCTNILTDKQNIYLKFSIKNNSSIDYELDFVEFNFVDKRSKNLNAKTQITPIYIDEKKSFVSKREFVFLYVIPVIAGTDNSYVEVIFREMNGTRKIVVNIPSKKINEAELIK